ncbi:MAG: 2'-5' RNA ligase family protein [Chitinophagaceae bacterium]|nr:MAG: 2'-5' RNA ligase family protein [Chitinophagaceae bacterium]
MDHRADNTEYLLIAYPDRAVTEKLLIERSFFRETYGVRPKQELAPHIVISSFFASEGMETTLVRWLQKICSLGQGFNIMLNNYSGYPDGTIFLRIPDPAPIQHFVGQLSAMQDFITPGTRGLYRRPHIAIASNLDKALYERALSDYSRKVFNESFQVKEIVLLKRNDPFTAVRTVQVFGLLPAGNDLFNKVA